MPRHLTEPIVLPTGDTLPDPSSLPAGAPFVRSDGTLHVVMAGTWVAIGGAASTPPTLLAADASWQNDTLILSDSATPLWTVTSTDLDGLIPCDVDFAVNDRLAVTVGDSGTGAQLRLLDLITGATLGQAAVPGDFSTVGDFVPPVGPVVGVSPDGTMAVTYNMIDQVIGWDLSADTPAQAWTFAASGGEGSVKASDTVVAVCDGSGARILSLADGTEIQTIAGANQAYRCTDDSGQLAVVDQNAATVYVLDAAGATAYTIVSPNAATVWSAQSDGVNLYLSGQATGGDYYWQVVDLATATVTVGPFSSATGATFARPTADTVYQLQPMDGADARQLNTIRSIDLSDGSLGELLSRSTTGRVSLAWIVLPE